MKTVGPGISLAIWFRSFAACQNVVDSAENPADSWITSGLIVDYHYGGETESFDVQGFFLAKRLWIPVQYPIFRPIRLWVKLR